MKILVRQSISFILVTVLLVGLLIPRAVWAGSMKIRDLRLKKVAATYVDLSWIQPEKTDYFYIVYSDKAINDDNKNITYYEFNKKNEETVVPAGEAQDFRVYGLDPDSEYYIAVGTGNDASGAEQLSDSLFVITATDDGLDSFPLNPVRDLNILSNANKEIELSWTMPEGADSFYVIYSKNPIRDKTGEGVTKYVPDDENLKEIDNFLEDKVFTVKGLKAGEDYYFAVVVSDKNEKETPYSNIVWTKVHAGDPEKTGGPSDYNDISTSTIDSDSDGLTDVFEVAFGSNPDAPDTDGDGYLDGAEIDNGYSPLKAYVKLFSDFDLVPWAQPYIIELVKRGVISGYGDDTFGPNKNISRVEYLKMLFNTLNFSVAVVHDKSRFSDVLDDSWFAPYVAYADKQDLITQRGSMFFPNEKIKRAEAVRMMVLAASLPVSKLTKSTFTDVGERLAPYVETAKASGLISEATLFHPERLLTRAEVAKMLVKLSEIQ